MINENINIKCKHGLLWYERDYTYNNDSLISIFNGRGFGLEDGYDDFVDLSKGLYDAGDLMKWITEY